jgi:GDPmannose 4,6-dehydratase
MNKIALICGITGQDGSYLAKYLIKKGYKIFGTTRDASICDNSRLENLGIVNEIELISLAPNDFRSVLKVIEFSNPHEIYYLAGLTSVGLSFEQPVEAMDSIACGTLNFLEAIKLVNKRIKFFNAGSSECFGNTNNAAATENTVFSPMSPYAIAKATAFWQVSLYRKSYDLFCCTGILGNHESPLRQKRFVTQKIISQIKEIKDSKITELKLGNLNTSRDWGWAPEYVEAMHLMLQAKKPDDFIIATGETNSLKNFVKLAFDYFGLNYKDHLKYDETLLRPSDVHYSSLDPSKIKKELGWEAETDFKNIIRKMYEEI